MQSIAEQDLFFIAGDILFGEQKIPTGFPTGLGRGTWP
jgi:hypothetical protein